jgi:gluconokinase
MDVSRGLYIVMGVSGAGKSLIAAGLARVLDVDFIEGDEYHPAENVARMAAGIPLTDDDRLPWLRALAKQIRDAKDAGRGLVVACSALKRSYRDVLREESGAQDLQFVFLRGPRSLIAERLSARRGHFMPPKLLESQFAALEEPSPDEHAWVCDIEDSPGQIIAALVARAST